MQIPHNLSDQRNEQNNNIFYLNDYLRENFSSRFTNDITNIQFYQDENDLSRQNSFDNISEINHIFPQNCENNNIPLLHLNPNNSSSLTQLSNNNLLNPLFNANDNNSAENYQNFVDTYFKLEMNKSNNINNYINTNTNLFSQSHIKSKPNFIAKTLKKKRGPKPTKFLNLPPKDRKDNFIREIMHKSFKSIGKVVFNSCKELGDEYRIQVLNKSEEKNSLKNNKSITKYLDKSMETMFIESNPKNSKTKDYNKKIYDKLVANGKLEQSPVLNTILKMTNGEVLYKFINDDNFVKKINPNNNDFLTFKDYISDFKEKHSDERINDIKKYFNDLLKKYT